MKSRVDQVAVLSSSDCVHPYRMAAYRFVISLCLSSVAFGKSVPVTDSPPKWPTAYSVSGVLRLPYAEIVEPWQAWFDGQNGRSRIDYYGGIILTTLRLNTLKSSIIQPVRIPRVSPSHSI